MAEGEEELFLFDEEDLVGFDPDEGPSLRRPLPQPPLLRPAPASGDAAEGSVAELAAGGYVFLQWRPCDEGS
jgi:hypothetical protein